MNFFIADVQTGFGTFVAFYLAHQGWSQENVDLALTVGGFAGVLPNPAQGKQATCRNSTLNRLFPDRAVGDNRLRPSPRY
jgi:hypothetical protein